MITFTKEQLIASAHARIDFAEMMLAGELEPLKERTWSIELVLARIALASLEAEPVAEAYQPPNVGICAALGVSVRMLKPLHAGESLYTAPPAPVSVPDEAYSDDCPDLYPSQPDAWAAGWNACRAAMLQGNHRDLSYPVDPQIAAYEKIMEQAIPDGYALVPVEPTAEMIEATFAGEMELQSVQHQIRNRERRAHYYRAMLAAAPQLEVK